MEIEDEDSIENLFGVEDLEILSEDEQPILNNRKKENDTTETANGTTENKEQPPKPKRIIRRNIPKFDSSVLLSDYGLIKLQTLISKTSFKRGKGHESENLNRLINVYQLWGHNLYPRYKFKSIIERTEKICSEKRLKIAYMAWKESTKYMNKYNEKMNSYDSNMLDDEEYMMNEDNERINEEQYMNTSNDNNNNRNDSNINTNYNNTNSNNINNEVMNTSSIPVSRLPHPLTDEERAFIVANRERAMKKLREKKAAFEQQKRLKEQENNVASTSTITTN